MKKLFLVILLLIPVVTFAVDDFEQQKATLLTEKQNIQNDIKKINAQITQTDSLSKAEQKSGKEQQARQKTDLERRQGEIEELKQKLSELNAEMQKEKYSVSAAQMQIENVNATRNALGAQLATHCRQLENFIKTSLPWDTEIRLERTSALCHDLESGSATAEEGFARLRAIYAEEIRLGDEVQISNRTVIRNNGEIVNANVLRIGNQWIVYQDDAGLLFGILNKKINEAGNSEYKWKENLSFEERQAVKTAIDVKLSRKPPQLVKLPLSLSINASH
jgi:predicted RNase H-like nuclease (RuvC/YqgF family)